MPQDVTVQFHSTENQSKEDWLDIFEAFAQEYTDNQTDNGTEEQIYCRAIIEIHPCNHSRVIS